MRSQRVRLGQRLFAPLYAIFVAACDVFGPQIDCGPLEASACREAVQMIEATLQREFPTRRVVLVEFLNEDGHANVRLDDGTEIGWGERL
jgi:hypothetical protein